MTVDCCRITCRFFGRFCNSTNGPYRGSGKYNLQSFHCDAMTTLPSSGYSFIFITGCHHEIMSVGWFIIGIIHREDVLSLFNMTRTDLDTLFIGREWAALVDGVRFRQWHDDDVVWLWRLPFWDNCVVC